MNCWSCDKQMPPSAMRCPHREAEAMAPPTPDDEAMARQLLANMSSEAIAQLQDALANAETGEEFANMVMIGPPCPK